MKSSWQKWRQDISHAAGQRWGSASHTIRVGCERLQTFKAVICRPFQILPATVHLGEHLGSNLIRLTAIPSRFVDSSCPPP